MTPAAAVTTKKPLFTAHENSSTPFRHFYKGPSLTEWKLFFFGCLLLVGFCFQTFLPWTTQTDNSESHPHFHFKVAKTFNIFGRMLAPFRPFLLCSNFDLTGKFLTAEKKVKKVTFFFSFFFSFQVSFPFFLFSVVSTSQCRTHTPTLSSTHTHTICEEFSAFRARAIFFRIYSFFFLKTFSTHQKSTKLTRPKISMNLWR